MLTLSSIIELRSLILTLPSPFTSPVRLFSLPVSPSRVGAWLWRGAAEPAFRRYGKSIGWHLKKGPHSITHEDWRFFMDYARNTLGW